MATTAPTISLYTSSGAATITLKMAHASAYNTGSGFVAALPSCTASSTLTPLVNTPIFCYGFKRAIITPIASATVVTAPTFAIYAIHANNTHGGTVTQSCVTLLETVAYAGAFATSYGSVVDSNTGSTIAVNAHAATPTVVTTGMALPVFDTLVACTSGTAGSTNTPATIYISNLAGATHLCICFTATASAAGSIGYIVTLTD